MPHWLRLLGKRTPARLRCSHDRIGIVVQTIELGAHHPRVLDELELSGNVTTDSDELEPAIGTGARRFGKQRGRVDGLSILTTAPDQAVVLAHGDRLCGSWSRFQ
jgi:hypothetical protein